jgi:hypothetical protein
MTISEGGETTMAKKQKKGKPKKAKKQYSGEY